MSWNRNTILQVSLGVALLGGSLLFPLPGESAAARPLEVGDSVLIWPEDRGRPWTVVGFNGPRDSVLLERGENRAIMATWECTLVE